jgi:hypothetical protein
MFAAQHVPSSILSYPNTKLWLQDEGDRETDPGCYVAVYAGERTGPVEACNGQRAYSSGQGDFPLEDVLAVSTKDVLWSYLL